VSSFCPAYRQHELHLPDCVALIIVLVVLLVLSVLLLIFSVLVRNLSLVVGMSIDLLDVVVRSHSLLFIHPSLSRTCRTSVPVKILEVRPSQRPTVPLIPVRRSRLAAAVLGRCWSWLPGGAAMALVTTFQSHDRLVDGSTVDDAMNIWIV
jgi:hypothetical protein